VTRRAWLFLLPVLLLPGVSRAQPGPAPVAPTAEAPAAEPGAAAAIACPARGVPAVVVAVQDRPPRILPPVPARALRAQAGGPTDSAFPHHLGLTVFSVESRSEITVRTQASEAGACALPAEVRLALVQTEHSIRLAREVPPGSCLAAEVLAHERRHAEVNRRTLRDTARELRATARAWAMRAEKRAADAGSAAAALQDDLAQASEPVLEKLRAARERAHAAIDRPAEYDRLSRVCPEDQRRLRAALRGA
jgi:hypothetical protein